jgi:calcineurin-like phosphoesterase family protein
MYFFTADEHYYHKNILEYCKRPFGNIEDMHKVLINNNNKIVAKTDIVVHAGDFSWGTKKDTMKIIVQLNGNHIFLQGSHDKWAKNLSLSYIFEKLIENQYIVVCHYAMRVWPRSHYGSVQLYGHSHGELKPIKNQWDVGIDNNNYYPISLINILELVGCSGGTHRKAI